MKFEPEHLDKQFFPDGTTKGELLEYYDRISNTMLPFLKDRPIVMHRFPDGIDGKDFYQKQVPTYFPDWIERVEVQKKETGEMQQLVVCNDKDTLLYLIDQGSIPIHAWLSRKDMLDKPDQMIFDLDPPKGNFDIVKEGAYAIKGLCEELQLKAYVKTSGSKGLHVHIPVRREYTFDQVRTLMKSLSSQLADEHEHFTVEHRKEKRKGRLFLDYLRNAYAQTAVAPYSVRAIEGAPVATPLHWDELIGLESSQKYTIDNIFRRLGQTTAWKDMERNLLDRAMKIDPKSLPLTESKLKDT